MIRRICLGNSGFGRHLCVMVTVMVPNVAVSWRLSSIPLIGTLLEPEGLKVHLPDETYDKGIWSILTTGSIGISSSSITFEMRFSFEK